MFGCNGKYNFPKIVFLLTRIYPLDPEMNLRSHFHFNSFPGHSPRTATQREREKRNTKPTKNTERMHPPILNPATESSDPATETSNPATQTSDPVPRPPIQPPRRPTQPPKRPIQYPNLRSSHRELRPQIATAFSESESTEPTAPITKPNTYHGEFSVTGSPVRSLHFIYIFLYIYIFINIYIFI